MVNDSSNMHSIICISPICCYFRNFAQFNLCPALVTKEILEAKQLAWMRDCTAFHNTVHGKGNHTGAELLLPGCTGICCVLKRQCQVYHKTEHMVVRWRNNQSNSCRQTTPNHLLAESGLLKKWDPTFNMEKNATVLFHINNKLPDDFWKGKRTWCRV